MIAKLFKPSIVDIIYTGLVKFLDFGSLLAVSVFLSNNLPINEYGVFITFERVAFLLAAGLLLGQDTLLRKKLSFYNKVTKKDIQLIKYTKSSTLFIYLLLSIPIFYYFKSNTNISEVSLFFTGSIIFTTLSFVNSSILIGKKNNSLGNLCRRATSRIFFCFLLGLMFLISTTLTLELISKLFFLSSLIQFLFSIYLINVKFKSFLFFKFIINFKAFSKNLTESIFFFLVQFSLLLAQQLPIILLTFFGNTDASAKYDVAIKISSLCLIPLSVTSGVVANRFAFYFKNNNIDHLNKVLGTTNSALKIIGILFSVIILFGGDRILALWGTNFQDSYLLLIILTIAQFFNLSFGHLGDIMKMVGLEKILLFINIGYLIINSTLAYIFVINDNIIGLGLSFVIVSILSNLIKSYILKKYSGIHTSFFKLKFYSYGLR